MGIVNGKNVKTIFKMLHSLSFHYLGETSRKGTYHIHQLTV